MVKKSSRLGRPRRQPLTISGRLRGMKPAQHYRERAAHLHESAETEADPQLRVQLCLVARGYDEFAGALERSQPNDDASPGR